ncbi:MAG TPA: type II secretion system protein [Gemmatimonadaceae bacterium]|jgi:type II secretory pathway pseudopilin PulG|nr:type II secretion system protein [Gemmatimonadaceae bacterium]
MRRGFAILEAIVAMTIIGLVSVGALGAFGADLRAAERADRMLPAAALAEERLTSLEGARLGPLSQLPDSLSRGRFEAPFDEYSWTATTTKPRPMEDLVEFRVEIAWGSGSFTLSERRYDPNGLAAR